LGKCLEPIPIEWSIFGVCQVVGAFLGREAIKQVSERMPKTFDGARGKLSEQRLQLGEGSLDRVEVGAVGRQISGKRPSRAS